MSIVLTFWDGEVTSGVEKDGAAPRIGLRHDQLRADYESSRLHEALRCSVRTTTTTKRSAVPAAPRPELDARRSETHRVAAGTTDLIRQSLFFCAAAPLIVRTRHALNSHDNERRNRRTQPKTQFVA